LSALELVGSGDEALNHESIIGGNRLPRLHLKEARSRIEEALGTCLLPSLQLIPANPAVGQEIWEVMSLLPYEVGLISVLFDSSFEKVFGVVENFA
jgi:THO complex subunit 2